jgi:hypothetical protein
MAEDARLKLELRLVPAEGEPNAALFDDLIRLIKQGIITAPKGVTQVNSSGEFHTPTNNSMNDLEAKIKHRIEQASADSRSIVEKRAELVAQPDGEAKLAAESLEAAQGVISAVQRAIIRGVAVHIVDENHHSNGN